MMNKKQIDKMMGSAKKMLKEAHMDFMKLVPPEERSALQRQMDSMINKAKQENNHPFMNDFMKEVYNR